VSIWPASDEPLIARNLGQRTGTELMAIGLILDLDRRDSALLADFWARLFVLERVDRPGS